MPRTVDPAAHARRREQFLDAAQRLITTRGYEGMSIRDVLVETGASRGALYHYFASKQELLSGVVERFGAAVTAAIEPIVADRRRSAPRKLHDVLVALTAPGDREHDALASTRRAWHAEGNARVRQLARAGIIARLSGLLRPVIAQGAREGVFEVVEPEPAARILATLVQDLHDDLADQVLPTAEPTVDLAAVRRTVDGYVWAMHRVLGVPAGSAVFDAAPLHAWFADRLPAGEP